MENKVVFEVYRDVTENIVGRSLSDKEWEVMASEIEDALDYYTNEEIPRLFAEIDNLVSEFEEQA